MSGKTPYQPRTGGRYIRDPKTGERVPEKETAAKATPARKKGPAPKAPQGQAAAAPDGAPASEGSAKREQPVRRDK